METKITLFKNSDFGEIRTLNIEGEPWFVLRDVCNILNILNLKDLVKRLEEDEVGRFDLPPTHKAHQKR